MESTALTSDYSLPPEKHESTNTAQPISATSRPSDVARNSIEKAKVALKRQPPYLEFFVHVLALAIIGGLLFVNIARYFWRDFSLRAQKNQNVELKAFQFAAKVHELLMLASLSFIVFTYMRKLLVGRRGIAFGLVSAPHTIASPSMLFKMKFWIGFGRNPAFGLMLVVACVLSVALGPSSAITMIPSLSWSDMNNALTDENSTIYYSGARDDLWPTVLNVSSLRMNQTEVDKCLNNPFNPTNLFCPTAGFLDMYKWFASFVTAGASSSLLFTDLYGGVQREVAIATDSSNGDGTESYTTVVTELTSRSLGTYFNYAKRKGLGAVVDVAYPRLSITGDTPIYQPVVYTRCELQVLSDEQQFDGVTNGTRFMFPSIRHSWVESGSYPDHLNYVAANHTVFDNLPSEQPRFLWFKAGNADSSASLLAVAVVPIMAKNATVDSYQSSGIVTCAVDARWAATDAYYQPMNSSAISSNVSDKLIPYITDGQYHAESLKDKFALSNESLNIDTQWATVLNGNQSDSDSAASNTTRNTTAMVGFLNLAVYRADDTDNTTAAFRVPNITAENQKGAIEEYVSMLIGTVIADGMARTSQLLYPALVANGTNGNGTATLLQAYLLPGSTFNAKMSDFGYSVRITLARYGYGYGIRNSTTWLAVSVLLIYALVTIVHMAFVVWKLSTRKYYGGGSWEDVAEFMALAINSSPSDRLYGTSAGIAKGATWENVVKIREMGDQHLELCFVGKGHEEGHMVEVGKKYL